MIKGVNYWCFMPPTAGGPETIRAAMDRAVELGYDSFEPTVDGEGAPLNIETTEREAAAVGRYAGDVGLQLKTLASGLGWSCSPTDPDPDIRERALHNSRRLLQIAAWLGADTLLYLPGMVSAPFVAGYPPQRYDLVEERARAAIEQLLPHAERVGVRIAIENVWNRFLLSPLEIRRFVDSFSSPYLGVYFDVGNCLLYGHPEHWIEILADRIYALHMKDFRVGVGTLDGFVDLLAGDVDFPAVMGALNGIGYRGPCTIEYVPPAPGTVEKAIVSLRLLEAAYEGAGG